MNTQMHATTVNLSPVQADAFERLTSALNVAPIVMLTGGSAAGKTTLLKNLCADSVRKIVSLRQLVERIHGHPHCGYEELFHQIVAAALDEADLVCIDDFDAIVEVNNTIAPRTLFVERVVLRALVELGREQRKKIVFTAESLMDANHPEMLAVPKLDARFLHVEIERMRTDDYSWHLRRAGAPSIDAGYLHSYAANLTVDQLQVIAARFSREGGKDAAVVRDFVERELMRSNTHVEHVAPILFEDLKGFEDAVEALETLVVGPLLYRDRFPELDLKPSRGVLLYGPPGTGKTSIGRALAHRMDGRFFLIDGTFVASLLGEFYRRVRKTFADAVNNKPAIIFIDDADVLFQDGGSQSFARYLLTMLDGLESKSGNQVAVIMTAMDPAHIPAAVIRSGRAELWLETKLPAAAVREKILQGHLAALPPAMRNADVAEAVRLTEGFNAADLRRVIADAKARHVRTVVTHRRDPGFTVHVTAAAQAVVTAKAQLARATRIG